MSFLHWKQFKEFFHGSLSLFYTVCTQFVYGYLICRLNTEFSLQTMLDITADERQFTTNISLCWHSSVINYWHKCQHIWLIQLSFRLVGWHFLPDEDGKMAETISIVPLSLSFPIFLPFLPSRISMESKSPTDQSCRRRIFSVPPPSHLMSSFSTLSLNF